jgi:SNF2 family DNA or RNA helicase
MSSICVNDAGQLVVDCPYDSRKEVMDVGGRWDAVLGAWVLAFSAEAVESLIDNLPNPSVDPSVERVLLESIERDRKLKKIRAMSKVDHPVNLKVPGLNGALYNYQKLGVMFALANGNGVLIADEMGLGKTLQAISTALYLKRRGEIEEALIIVPPSLKYNWSLEIEKWTDEKYVVIDGPPDDRVAQWLKKDVFFYVVNFELLLEDLFGGRNYKEKENETTQQKIEREAKMAKSAKRARILKPIKDRRWGFITVDEAHALKNSMSKRSKNVRSLRSKFRMALTGTPMDGRLEELHSVMEFVCPGLFGSRTRFMQRHAETDFYGKVKKYKRIGEVKNKISPHFIRRLKKDVLHDLPDKVYNNRMVLMTPAEKKTYKMLANSGHVATLESEALVATIRCKQFCDSPNLVANGLERELTRHPNDGRKIERRNHPNLNEIEKEINSLRKLKSSKLEIFKEILQEVVIENAHKVLIFSQYAEMVKVLMEVFDEMGLKYLCIWGATDKKLRADYQKRFNEDKTIDIMVGTEAMSTGLNFTSANYVINYDDNWAPAFMAQREDRAHRIGQKNVVTVINFICVDTIEERIRSVLYEKSSISAQALGDDTDEMVLKRLGPQDVAKLL